MYRTTNRSRGSNSRPLCFFQCWYGRASHESADGLLPGTLRGTNALYLANDGGVYRTIDGGATGLRSLAVAQYYRGISLPTSGAPRTKGTRGSRIDQVMGGDGYTAFDVESR